MKTRTVVAFGIAILSLLSVSCSKSSFVASGPPDSQIKPDASSEFVPCTQNHNTVVDDVKISEKKVENNQATVFVGVEYHWTINPTMMQAYISRPCSSLNKSVPKGMVPLKMIYRKYDSEWKLASIETEGGA